MTPNAEKQAVSIKFLDGLRGLAALYVMISHAKPLLLEGVGSEYSQHPEVYTFVGKAVIYSSLLFVHPHLAVLVFFLLSGFVITLKYSRKILETPDYDLDIKSYLVKRIRRIYPPFLLSIVLAAVLDYIACSYGSPLFLTRTSAFQAAEGGGLSFNFLNLLGNVFFLMKAYVPTWSVNQPLWSLMYEWWFYMLFIPLFYLWRKNAGYPFLLILLLFLVSCFSPIPIPIKLFQLIFGKMILWWFGVVLADMYTGRINISFARLIPLTLCLPLAAFLFRLERTDLSDFVWGIGFMGLFSLLFYLQERGFSLAILEKLKPLGDFSYSLYIVHYPILMFIAFLAGVETMQQDRPDTTLYFLGAIVVCLAFSKLCYLWVEKPFMQAKR